MGKVLILTGHSGSGKDAVSAKLQQGGYFVPIIPHTTRAMRDGESEGNPYHFTDAPTFDAMVLADEFLEYKSYVTQFNGVRATANYGTAHRSIHAHEDSVITIGVLAALELKAKLGDRATLVYLHVDDDIRKERAIARGSFDPIEWDNRLAQDHERFKDGLPEGIDFIVNNMWPIERTVAAIAHADY